MYLTQNHWKYTHQVEETQSWLQLMEQSPNSADEYERGSRVRENSQRLEVKPQGKQVSCLTLRVDLNFACVTWLYLMRLMF